MSEDMNVELPDEDIELEEGAHDLKNAEAQSIASVAKTDDSIKKAPPRKGDKPNAKDEPSKPKTKAGMINAMYSKMSKAKKEELSALYDKLIEEGFDEEVEEVELPDISYDFSDDLEALVESEATLSDEFKAKTAVIFETAINSKIAEEVSRLEDEYQEKLESEVDATREDLVEKVDNYLNYVVEQWMEENKLAVESGLRTEIAEGFMNSLKDLFVESYIDVPESKVDLVDELAASVEELEEKLNEQTGTVIEMTEKLEEFQREAIIRESSRDLADTQVEKLRSLVSSLDFEDEESFSSKVKTVKESYFKKEVSSDIEEIVEDFDTDQTAEISSAMDMYLKAIKKTNKE
jgi:hypothetical protein